MLLLSFRLDLDKWINEPESDSEGEGAEDLYKNDFFKGGSTSINTDTHRKLFDDDDDDKTKKTKKGSKGKKGRKGKKTIIDDDDDHQEGYDSDQIREV